jgi:hypothetical protein
MTHQLTVLSGKTTWISSKLHQFLLENLMNVGFQTLEETPNLTGKLGHLKNLT